MLIIEQITLHDEYNFITLSRMASGSSFDCFLCHCHAEVYTILNTEWESNETYLALKSYQNMYLCFLVIKFNRGK